MALDFQKLSKDDREEIRACMEQELAQEAESAFDTYTYGFSKSSGINYVRKTMFQDHKFDEETLSKIADMMDAENDEIPPFDLDMFARHLKELIAAPQHLKIYALARKILKHEHQREFAARVPDLAETKLTLVIKNPDEPGFSLAGGAENGLAIYVDDVSFNLKTRKSTMNPFGKKLQIGDQILQVNKYSLDKCTLEQSLEIFKKQAQEAIAKGTRLKLTIRPCGYYPVIDGKNVSWEFNGAYDYKNESTTVLIQLGSDEKHGLGVMEHLSKYVIHRIQPGAVADKIGLKVGDIIERLDGESLAKKSMHDVTIALKKKQVSFSFKTASRHELETFLEDLKCSRRASEYQKTIQAVQQRIGIKSEAESNDKTNFLGSEGEAKSKTTRAKRMTIMEEVDDEQFDLQFVEAKRKSIIVRSDSSPGFLSRTGATVTDGEPIPPKPETPVPKIDSAPNLFFGSRKSIILKAAEINGEAAKKRLERPSVRKTVSFDQPDSVPKNWNFNPEDLARIKEKEEARASIKIAEKEAPSLDKSIEEEVVIDTKPDRLAIKKSKTQTILERKFRQDLAKHGGRGTITVPHNMRTVVNKTGQKYKIEVTDRFVVEFYLDSELQCALKSVEWVKVKAGVDFAQTSVLPGDQILSIDGVNCQGKSMFFIRNKLQERSKERATEIEVFHTKRTVGDVLKHANAAVTEKAKTEKASSKIESSEVAKAEITKTETTKSTTKLTTKLVSVESAVPTVQPAANPVKPLATAF